ncbi:uncharacterized protein LOC122048464 [Zingiber officinale]|uniref:uncharacterized protein LOC122048464 n=1 Tax=Zingiber officinale TaxID=94328 RepID=UPI001C4AA463|nr:uncharacterized protein LOC122048464 [Zingiber officinale]
MAQYLRKMGKIPNFGPLFLSSSHAAFTPREAYAWRENATPPSTSSSFTNGRRPPPFNHRRRPVAISFPLRFTPQPRSFFFSASHAPNTTSPQADNPFLFGLEEEGSILPSSSAISSTSSQIAARARDFTSGAHTLRSGKHTATSPLRVKKRRVYHLFRTAPSPTGSSFLPTPICSHIESDFGATERQGVRLYYGARNLQRMTYQESFKDWESIGVKIIPILSQPDERWSGERGYVQELC